MELIKEALTVVAAVFGVLAAQPWFHASQILVDDDPTDMGWKITKEVRGHRINVIRTADAQTVWNARASTCAAVAAIAQALLLFF